MKRNLVLTNLKADKASEVAAKVEKYRQAGAIQPLVQLLKASTSGERKQAARALWILSANDENMVAIAQAGGIEPLVQLLKASTSGEREQAAGALDNLAFSDKNKVAIAQARAAAGV